MTTRHAGEASAAIPPGERTPLLVSPFYGTPPQGQRLARLCFAKNESTLDAAIARLQAL